MGSFPCSLSSKMKVLGCYQTFFLSSVSKIGKMHDHNLLLYEKNFLSILGLYLKKACLVGDLMGFLCQIFIPDH